MAEFLLKLLDNSSDENVKLFTNLNLNSLINIHLIKSNYKKELKEY